MRVFENKILRRIFIPKIEDAAKEEVYSTVLRNSCAPFNSVEINMRNRRKLYRITFI